MAITLNGTTGITTPALDSVAQFSSADMPAGSVLQVVSATTATQVTVASTSFVDSGLSASITPTSTSSKILVLTRQGGYMGRDLSYGLTPAETRLLRNATEISINKYRFRAALAGDGRLWTPLFDGFCTLDSPNTTSAVTYKTQGKIDATADSAALRFQSDSSVGSIVLMEIAA